MEREFSDYYRDNAAYSQMLKGQGRLQYAAYIKMIAMNVPRVSAVIDIGCGAGLSTILLRELGFNTIGTDVSESSLPKQAGFEIANFENRTRFGESAFDAACCFNVLEHIERPKDFLKEMFRVVRPGGKLIILAPNLTSPLIGVRVIVDLLKKRTPYLGVNSYSEALALIVQNTFRTLIGILGFRRFRQRRHKLETGIIGYDVDAVYWTNSSEIAGLLKDFGCEILVYQGQGRSMISKLISKLLPPFSGQVCIVAKKAE